MSFKENLKSELEYQGLQIKELAAKCGVSKNTLGNYLTGHNSLPAADTAVKIAKALGVSVEYLVTGKNTESSDGDIASEMLLFQKYRSFVKKLDQLPQNTREGMNLLLDKLCEK